MSRQLPSLSPTSLDLVTGGAGARPQKPISLDATNGLLDHWAESLGIRPSQSVVNGTKVPRQTHEAVGKLLGGQKR